MILRHEKKMIEKNDSFLLFQKYSYGFDFEKRFSYSFSNVLRFRKNVPFIGLKKFYLKGLLEFVQKNTVWYGSRILYNSFLLLRE